MTLATIVSLFIAVCAPAPLVGDGLPVDRQDSQNQASQNQASQNQASQNQAGGAGQTGNAGTGAPSQAPTASQGQAPSPSATTGQKKQSRHKKKETAGAPADCPPANSASSGASGDGANASAPGKAAPSNGSPANPAPPTPAPSNDPASKNMAPKNAPPKTASSSNTSSGNCPPAKTVVPEGGTTEPSIQLIGGVKGAEQGSQQRSTTEQLLESTEDNLKKVAGRQLSASQQEMVNQIQQFIQQSKAAVATGDVGRGHNLAQKAHLLSDELVKP